MKNELTILIGGSAGQGLVTIGQSLAKALVKAGYYIVVQQDYMSRVRGGYNTFAIRTSTQPIFSPKNTIDLLVALNQQAVDSHGDQLSPQAIVIADQGLTCGATSCFNVPFTDLAGKRFTNTVALGVASCFLGLEKKLALKTLLGFLGKKEEEIVLANEKAMDQAYSFALKGKDSFEPLEKVKNQFSRVMLNGNEALALGAIAKGLNFLSFYPMTPSTSIALTVIKYADKMNIAYEQVEDEISAINMAIGASYAGACAMVTTSGGGFALMAEGLSLAGITETPVVITIAMRPGPATGLPTRTEQADLEFALYGGHGEFPRAILTPGSVEECFHLAGKALELAEISQGPVIILTDQYLADSFRAIKPFDTEKIAPIQSFRTNQNFDQTYKRYEITESGLSPRAIPGMGHYLVLCDSDEHTEDGHITEDLSIRIKMNDKRLKKEQILKQNLTQPSFYGPKDPELILINWGSSLGSCKEAAQILSQKGKPTACCHFSQVWPLDPKHFIPYLEKAKQIVVVEGNANGQFAGILRKQIGLTPDQIILRYDGLPLTPEYILTRLETGV